MTDILVEPRVGTELLEVMASLRRALRKRVGRVGPVAELTDAQRELVRAVRLNPGIRVGKAAEDLRLAPNTVSTVAGSLVSAGWLERETDPDDGRSACLRLSATAQESVAEWRDRRLTVLDEAMGQLSAGKRRQIEDGVAAMLALLANLEEGE